MTRKEREALLNKFIEEAGIDQIVVAYKVGKNLEGMVDASSLNAHAMVGYLVGLVREIMTSQ